MNKKLLLIFFAGTIAMIFIMADSGKTLKTAATPNGIVQLELASRKASTDTILNAWLPTAGNGSIDNIVVARNNTNWDFVFIFFYAGFLFLFCKQLATHYNNAWKKVGNALAVAIIFAALLDVAENIGMLQTLNGNGSDTVAMFTAVCSWIKWTFVALVVAYALGTGIVWIFKKIRG